mmetsp:Transcript_13079/g.35615  ORF Transcript_13079/g.35615 Transcript_13079/m.35615 type:complete len:208 (-) Transcript_13079:299-922(-)
MGTTRGWVSVLMPSATCKAWPRHSSACSHWEARIARPAWPTKQAALASASSIPFKLTLCHGCTPCEKAACASASASGPAPRWAACHCPRAANDWGRPKGGPPRCCAVLRLCWLLASASCSASLDAGSQSPAAWRLASLKPSEAALVAPLGGPSPASASAVESAAALASASCPCARKPLSIMDPQFRSVGAVIGSALTWAPVSAEVAS